MMTVARMAVPFGGRDVFTGQVQRNGHPGRLVRVRLLMRPAAGGGAWRVVATGATSANGTVRLAGPLMTAGATFELAGAGKLASVTSAPVTVTIIPRVTVRVSTTALLTVTVWPAAAGDPAILQVLHGGAWQPVANLRLVAHQATYQATPGATYRVVVAATRAHDAGTSAPVTAPASAYIALASGTPTSAARPAVPTPAGTASPRTTPGAFP
jgi:hypothetical protein